MVADKRSPVTFPKIPVLLYHHVHDMEENFFRVMPAKLREQMELLLEAGYLPVHPDRLIGLKGQSALPEKYVLVTFDDAYEDFLFHAWPVLRELGIPTLLFVISDYIGGWNDWDPLRVSRHRHLDCDQLIALRDEGVIIGSHTCTHPALPYISREDQLSEIKDSKKKLEDLLGISVRALSYPGGHVNGQIAAMVAEQYDLGFATSVQVKGRFHDPYFIPRIDPWFFGDLNEFRKALQF